MCSGSWKCHELRGSICTYTYKPINMYAHVLCQILINTLSISKNTVKLLTLLWIFVSTDLNKGYCCDKGCPGCTNNVLSVIVAHK